MTDDVSRRLVAELEQDAELVDRGGFRLDLRQARSKLRAFQLGDANRFVLLLVEAAHLLEGCTAIEFEFGGPTTVRMPGVALDAEDLRQWFDPLLVGLAGLEGAPRRHMLGRQRLAFALNAVLDLARVAVISIRAAADEDEAVSLVFNGDAPTQERERPAAGGPMLTLELGFRGEINGRIAAQRALLRGGARFARLPVRLDGERVDGRGESELLGVVALADGQGRAGWSPDLFGEGKSWTLLVANGVVVEGLPRRGPPGVLVVLDADTLERDLSLTRIRRDAAFERMVAAASEFDGLGRAPMFVPTHLHGELFAAIVLLPFVTMFTVFAVLGLGALVRPDPGATWGQTAVLVAFGVLSTLVCGALGYRLIHVFGGQLRHRRLRRAGQRRLAVVRAIEKLGTVDKISSYRIDVRVERPERGDYDASLTAPLDSWIADELEARPRVFVRVDPHDERRLVFDRPLQGSAGADASPM